MLSLSTPFWPLSDDTKCPSLNELNEWIINNVTYNSHCYPTITNNGSPLKDRSNKNNILLNNNELTSKFVYETLEQLYSPILINKISKRTIIKTDNDIGINKTNIIKITNNNKSHFYLLARSKFQFIHNNTDCLLVTGVTDKIIISNCHNCQIISATKSIELRDCSNVTLYLCCNSSPIIDISNNNIIVAPYNTYYPLLQTHLSLSNLLVDLHLNYWNKILPNNNNNNNNNNSNNSKLTIVKCMEPSQYFPITTPFTINDIEVAEQNTFGITTSNPIELPIEYSESLLKKQEMVIKMKNAIEELPTNCKIELQSIIENKFNDWLIESNSIQQINELLKLEKEINNAINKSPSKSPNKSPNKHKTHVQYPL